MGCVNELGKCADMRVREFLRPKRAEGLRIDPTTAKFLSKPRRCRNVLYYGNLRVVLTP